MSKVKKPVLDIGTTIRVHFSCKPLPRSEEGVIEAVTTGRLEIKGVQHIAEKQSTARLDYIATADARYTATATVLESSRERLVVALDAEWTRIQVRSEFRLQVYGLAIEVKTPNGRAETEQKACELIDLASGGLSFATRSEYEIGKDVECSFVLEGEGRIDAIGRVLRVMPRSSKLASSAVAVQFTDISESDRQAITSWSMHQQIRRRK
jgi:c-di-GMP-binding flagellar brake protein YcgR